MRATTALILALLLGLLGAVGWFAYAGPGDLRGKRWWARPLFDLIFGRR